MTTKQGGVELLKDPVAQELLRSTTPIRLAYVWYDGTPRVIPIYFHWDGKAIVMGTPPTAPKVKVLQKNPKVALTLDGTVWPYKVLLMRGTARVTVMDGIVPEYALACKRYMGEEGAAGWLAQIGKMFTQMARIAVQPAWVGIIDFEQRFPSAIERAMAGAH